VSLWVFMLLIFLVFCFSFCCYFNLTLTICNLYKFWSVLSSLHLSLMLSRLCNLYKFSIFWLTY
jgi:hypothetical protein